MRSRDELVICRIRPATAIVSFHISDLLTLALQMTPGKHQNFTNPEKNSTDICVDVEKLVKF
mgnify:CR=1 FL=1